MKIQKKSLAVILAVLTVFFSVCVAFTATAASVKQGTYKKVTKENVYYKISVPGEGYITLTAKSSLNPAEEYSYASMDCELLNSKKEYVTDYSSDSILYSYTNGHSTDSKKIPVSKGTYYVRIRSVGSTYGATNQFMYTFTSVKQPTNYCIAKATTLKASKKATVYQTPKYNFDRWFKITLSKNKRITITQTGLSCDFDLYNADGKKVELEYQSRTSKSKIKLASGTYYIRCEAIYDNSKSGLTTFYWK